MLRVHLKSFTNDKQNTTSFTNTVTTIRTCTPIYHLPPPIPRSPR